MAIKDQIVEGFSYTLYPNPDDKYIIMQMSESTPTPYRVIITDIFGKKMLSKEIKSSNKNINTASFSNGIYFIKIQYDKKLTGKNLWCNTRVRIDSCACVVDYFPIGFSLLSVRRFWMYAFNSSKDILCVSILILRASLKTCHSLSKAFAKC